MAFPHSQSASNLVAGSTPATVPRIDTFTYPGAAPTNRSHLSSAPSYATFANDSSTNSYYPPVEQLCWGWGGCIQNFCQCICCGWACRGIWTRNFRPLLRSFLAMSGIRKAWFCILVLTQLQSFTYFPSLLSYLVLGSFLGVLLFSLIWGLASSGIHKGISVLQLIVWIPLEIYLLFQVCGVGGEEEDSLAPWTANLSRFIYGIEEIVVLFVAVAAAFKDVLAWVQGDAAVFGKEADGGSGCRTDPNSALNSSLNSLSQSLASSPSFLSHSRISHSPLMGTTNIANGTPSSQKSNTVTNSTNNTSGSSGESGARPKHKHPNYSTPPLHSDGRRRGSDPGDGPEGGTGSGTEDPLLLGASDSGGSGTLSLSASFDWTPRTRSEHLLNRAQEQIREQERQQQLQQERRAKMQQIMQQQLQSQRNTPGT